MNKNPKFNFKFSSFIKFIVPSLIGILLFMTPVKIDGNFTIPIAFLSNLLVESLGNILPLLAVIVISISAIGSIIIKIFRTVYKIFL